MTSARFDDLKKLPANPAARIIAHNNIVLQTQVTAPASATVAELLSELHEIGAVIDMLQLLAHALPPREATWWACLSARDLLPDGSDRLTPSIKAAEDWVLRPGEETRTLRAGRLDSAPNDDDTVFCAMAATFADGTLAPANTRTMTRRPVPWAVRLSASH